MCILVLNCGSSSIKFAVIDPSCGERILEGGAENLGGAGPGSLRWLAGDETGGDDLAGARHEDALRSVTDLLGRQEGLRDSIRGVGHRVVHGGEHFTETVLIDNQVVAAIEAHVRLAPLHNPPNLLGIHAARELLPEVPQVAVSTPPSIRPCRGTPICTRSRVSSIRRGESAATASMELLTATSRGGPQRA